MSNFKIFLLFDLIWCMFVMAGCTYLVARLDWSPYWFVLAVLLCGNTYKETKKYES